MNQNYFEPNPCYDSNSFGFDQPPHYTIDHQEDLNQQSMNDVDDIWNKIIKSGNKVMQILEPLSNVITTSPAMLPTEDPEYSLIIGNEELNIIPEKESDEFIKSSVEDLVSIRSESEDTSGSDSECIYLHMSVASILEGFTDEPPIEKNDDLFDLELKNDDWKKILYDAPILMSEDKVFDPEIHDQIFSPTYVSLPFTDRHYLFFSYVVRIFLPRIAYPVVSPFLISSGSEDTIFDPGIFAFHFSHRSGTFISFNVYPKILTESPMEICSSTYFYPNITMI
nr:hypothetical protein [Tanacetum cinerariifolium]